MVLPARVSTDSHAFGCLVLAITVFTLSSMALAAGQYFALYVELSHAAMRGSGSLLSSDAGEGGGGWGEGSSGGENRGGGGGGGGNGGGGGGGDGGRDGEGEDATEAGGEEGEERGAGGGGGSGCCGGDALSPAPCSPCSAAFEVVKPPRRVPYRP